MTTVLHLRKSYSEWTPVEGEDPVGSKPRYRWFPERIPAFNVRPTMPPALHHVTRELLMDFVRCGQVVDGQVVIDGGSAGVPVVYSIGEVPEGGNPDEIPLSLVSGPEV